MADNIIYPHGNSTITIPAGQSIAVYSQDAFTFQQVIATANYPQVNGNPVVVQKYTSTTFGPYASGSNVVVSAGSSPVYYQVGSVPITDASKISISSVLTSGMSVALFGDSLTRNNHWTGLGSDPTLNSQIGYWTFASQILGKRFIYDASYNFGILGNTTTQMLARISDVIAKKPSICVVLGGINDVGTGVSADTIQSNLSTIWSTLNAAGISVVAGCIFPSSGTAMDATKAKVLMSVNEWMRRTVPTLPNVHLWDSFFTLSDLTSSTAGALASCYVVDLLHLGRRGAYLAGADLAAVMNAAYPAVNTAHQGSIYGTQGLSDTYDAVNNPSGNLIASSLLAGTTGTNAGAYATGNVATGWAVFRPAGTTIVCVSAKNVITLANGQTYEEQQLSVSSPGGGSALEEISFQRGTTTAAGDNLIGGAYIDVSALSGNVNYVSARLQPQYGTFAVIAEDGKYGGATAGTLADAYVGKLQTPTGAVPAGGTVTNFAIVVGLDCTVASSVVVKVRLPYVRKV